MASVCISAKGKFRSASFRAIRVAIPLCSYPTPASRSQGISSGSMVPNTVDGTTPAWIATLDTLAKTNAQYTFIPGHGDVANARDVIAFRDYLGAVRTLVGDVQRQGKSGAALVEAVLPTLKKNYGQWDFFAFLAEPNIRDMEAELSGKKRVPQP